MTAGTSENAEIWVLADDRAGNVAQCLGVAEALGVPFVVKTLRYDRLARPPNLLRGAGLTGVTAESRAVLAAPWPRLVIAAGRRTAPVARWIRRQCGAKLVQIMDPGFPGRGDFDLIVSPAHDRPGAGGNVLEVLGAPHRVTPERLAAEAEKWNPAFSALPRPWVAVIVGGATKNRPFPVEMAETLGRNVARLAGGMGGSVLLTTSRRTGAAQEAALARGLPEPRWLHLFSQGGDNPYFGFLALADAVVVTGDSVSMCCEACASAAPVFIWAPEGWAAPKHARLHAQLYQAGLARPLEGAASLEGWERPRLNAAEEVARAIRERLLP
ncbi:mitochondrial fission ELM1 family protein [Paramagnetospirillum magneticum]|uniref:Predicted nucleoside-diphosphate-sugar epimerase n=1 Tax=Paramagnetospirillum magneticum (strain ATCC 700264 / AMB-1) TaxID=342108 RepID=Q2W5I8_PARM1|nr:mitochondrial fission ELM1 family protein [Paramagnetospirillum magneticum]BAE50887.1 Predicted nucleoside-diphosphate-sugar epimerase [Paramagnetospirillum magneticum AMB-1]